LFFSQFTFRVSSHLAFPHLITFNFLLNAVGTVFWGNFLLRGSTTLCSHLEGDLLDRSVHRSEPLIFRLSLVESLFFESARLN
jgi:hypothetical protein